MLVSTIISNALSKADLSNQNFYTPADQLFDVQLSWERIYSFLCENDSDYFITSLYLNPSTDFTVDNNRSFLYLYPLPADFFRLRMLSYLTNTAGQFYRPCDRMDVLNFGSSQSSPGYRTVGSNLEIYDPYNYSKYNFWYYPSPLSALGITSGGLLTTTDISFPNNMMAEFMVWEVAADIRRKQKEDPTLQQQKAEIIMQTMKKQSSRDDFRTIYPKDIFNNGAGYWI